MSRPIVASALPPTHDFRYWQDKLQKANLPVSAENKANILRELNRPATNNQRIANALAGDPVLTLRILMKANRRLASQQTEARSLLHAVSVLGINDTLQAIQRAEEFTSQDLSSDANLYGYALALQQSLFAAQLSRALHTHKSAALADEIYLNTLLASAYQWGLWHIAPDHCQNLRGLLANPAYTLKDLEVLAIGCSFKQLFRCSIATWSLPETLHEAAALDDNRYQRFLARTHHLPDAQWWDWRDYSLEARQLSQRPYWPALLCNQLAESTYWSWDSRQTQRWCKILARLLPMPLDDVIAICHQTAAQLEPIAGLNTADHPAHRLLGHFNLSTQIAALAPAKTAEPTTPEAVTEEAVTPVTRQRFRNSALLSANKERLRNRGEQFANLHQLMNATLDTLRDGLGIEQVAIMSTNRDRTQLQTRYHGGIGSDESLKTCKVNLPASGGPLLNQLLKKPGGILITPSKVKQLQGALPKPLAAALSAPIPADPITQTPLTSFYCALVSVFYGDQPIAVICLRAQQLSHDDYLECRQICQDLTLALKAFARKGKKTAGS